MKPRIFLILFLLILAITIFFRFYKLAEIPPGLYPDIAMNGTDALSALKTGQFKLFYPENNGREGFFINLIALSFAIFGPSIWAIKVVAAIIGTLTVIGVYFLTKQLFAYLARPQNSDLSNKPGINIKNSPTIIALLATFFIAISFWHLDFSRIGFRAIMVPFCLVWSFYFLFKGLNPISNRQLPGRSQPNDTDNMAQTHVLYGSSWFYLILAGLFFGLGFHTYIAFRVAPAILVPIFVFEIARYWPRIKLGRWIIFAAALLIAASPMIYYYGQHPADFMGRAGQVSIFASQSPIKTLFDSTFKTLGQFVIHGDYNWRHNISGVPEIFWPLIPFFLIGLFYSLIQIFKRGNYKKENLSLAICHWTLLSWWGALLLPAIMTNEGLPHALRSIGAIPPAYIFAGLGVFLIISLAAKKIQTKFSIATSLIIFFIALAGLAAFAFWQYFIYWGQNPEVKGAFTERFVDETNYINSLPESTKIIVIVNENGVAVPYPNGIPMPAQTIIFLTEINQTPRNIDYLKPEQFSQFLNRFVLTGSTVFLPMAYDQKIFDELQSRFPNGQIETKNGFSVFKINPLK